MAGTIVLTKGDIMINSARYLQVLEGHRTDVVLLDQELLTYPWYNAVAKQRFPHVAIPGDYYFPGRKGTYDMRRFLDANFKRGFKIFLAYGWKEHDYSRKGHYDVRPFGVVQEVVPASDRTALRALPVSDKAPPAPALAYSRALQRAFPAGARHRLPAPGRYGPLAWEHVVASDYRQALALCGFELMNLAEKLGRVDAAIVAKHAATLAAPSTIEPTAACLGATDATEVLYCGLLLSRGFFDAVLDAARWDDPPPTHVRRNLGVVYQTLLKFDGANAALVSALVATLQQHLDDVADDPQFSAKDKANIANVVAHYRQQLKGM